MAALRLPTRTGRTAASCNRALAGPGRRDLPRLAAPVAAAAALRSPRPLPPVTCPTSSTRRPAAVTTTPRATGRPPSSSADDDATPTWASPPAIAGLVLWAAFLAYAILLSPDQTPTRDAVFIQKLSGLGTPGSTPVNAVFTALWTAMAAWPAIYACLLIPAGRSKSGLPAWPFVAGSFALGAFALLPYFALHTPGGASSAAPPSAAELTGTGWRGSAVGVLESRALAFFLAALSAFALGSAAAAGPAAWTAYAQLFQESRLVHVTTLDFITLSACAWSWVQNDAAARGVVGGAPGWAAVPLVGPAGWLAVRPRAGGE